MPEFDCINGSQKVAGGGGYRHLWKWVIWLLP